MQDWLVGIVGSDLAPLASILLSAIVVVILVFVVVRLLRGVMRGGIGFRSSDGPRVEIVDVTAIDPKRKLVLVRRDQVEHLLLIGGGNDLVIEARIGRPPPPPARRVEQDFVPEDVSALPRVPSSVAPAPRAEPIVAAMPRPAAAQQSVTVRGPDPLVEPPVSRFEGPPLESISPRVEAPTAVERARAPASRVEPSFPSSPVAAVRAPQEREASAAAGWTQERRVPERDGAEAVQGDRATPQVKRDATPAPTPPVQAPLIQAPTVQTPSAQARPVQAPMMPAPPVQPARSQATPSLPTTPSPTPRAQPSISAPVVASASRTTGAASPFAGLGSAVGSQQGEPQRQRESAPPIDTGSANRTAEPPRQAPAVRPIAPEGERSGPSDAARAPQVAPQMETDKVEARAPLTVRSFASSISERPRTASPAAAPAVPVVQPAAASFPSSAAPSVAAPLAASPAAMSVTPPKPTTNEEEDDDLARMLSQELSLDDDDGSAPPVAQPDAHSRSVSSEAAHAKGAEPAPELSIEEEMERLMRDFSAHTNDRR